MCGGGHAWQGVRSGRRDGHCSGRYASYWNAFLFKLLIVSTVHISHIPSHNTNVELLCVVMQGFIRHKQKCISVGSVPSTAE